MRRWVPLVLLIATFFAKAQNTRSEAIERISRTNVFAFGGVGFAGTTSDGEKDFRVIISLPSAAKDFETIYATGTPEAKGYALAGMRELAKVRFKELLRSLQSSQAQLETMQGCIRERRSLVKVAREIDSGRYDIWIKSDGQLH
jgi:hypothetical protein